MNNLHVYSLDDEDFVVAESTEDAWAVALDLWGGTKSDYEGEFEQVPDDKEISISVEDEEELTLYQLATVGEIETKPAVEWAKVVGRNYLCGNTW